MRLNKEEEKQGIIWFFIAAPVAILLTFALYTVDETLTHSKAEADMASSLKELRGAQSSLSTGSVDPRLVAAKASMANFEEKGLVAVPAHEDHETH